MPLVNTPPSVFPVGNIVWGAVSGFPWWPAMVVSRAHYEPRLDSNDHLPPETPENRLVLFLNDNRRVAVLDMSQLQDYSTNMYLIHGVHDTRLINAARYANFYFAKDNPHRKDAIKEMEIAVLSAYNAAKTAAGSLQATVSSQSLLSSLDPITDATELAVGTLADFPAVSAAEAAVAAGRGTVVQADLTNEVPPTSPFTPPGATHASRAASGNGRAVHTAVPISSPEVNPSLSQVRGEPEEEESNFSPTKHDGNDEPQMSDQPRRSLAEDEGGKKNHKLTGCSGRSSMARSGNELPVKLVLPVKRQRLDPNIDEQRTGMANSTGTRNLGGMVAAQSDVLARLGSVFAELQECAGNAKSLMAGAQRAAKEKAAQERGLSAVVEKALQERARQALARKERVEEERKLKVARSERVQEESLARKAVAEAKVAGANNRLLLKKAKELEAANDLRRKLGATLEAANEARRNRGVELDAENEKRIRRGVQLDAENELRSSREKESEARCEELRKELRKLQGRRDEDEAKVSTLRVEFIHTGELVAAEKKTLYVLQAKNSEAKKDLRLLQAQLAVEKKAKAKCSR